MGESESPHKSGVVRNAAIKTYNYYNHSNLYNQYNFYNHSNQQQQLCYKA